MRCCESGGGGSTEAAMGVVGPYDAQISRTTTLSRTQNNFPSVRHIWTISRFRCRCFPQLHWKHIVVWGKYQDEGRMWEGEVGPTTSGRLDRSRLKGARPCLGLPILPPILTPLLSSLDIMVCSNMIIKMNHLCAGKGYFLVTSGSSKSNLNQNIFSEKPDSECLHLSPMAVFFLVVTNGEFVSGRHQQIYPALTLLRQTVQLCKFSTSVLFSRSRLHRQHFSAHLIISILLK